MRYYKVIEGNYITIVGIGCCDGIEITEEEYNMIMKVIYIRPEDDDRYYYKLRKNLIWEQFEQIEGV